MLKPGKQMITADDDSGTPRAPPIGLCKRRPMPSTESPLADCTFRFVEVFEKQLSQALSITSMEDQANRPHRKAKVKKKHTGGKETRDHNEPQCTDFFTDKNPKAFAYANPGKLQKQATRSHDACSLTLSHHLQHLMNPTGQRKAPPCSSRRSPPCRTSPYHRCGRWSSRRWENHSHQISHQAVHQTYPLPPCWSSYRGHIQTTTSDVPRMPLRLPRLHDRR